MYTCPVCGYDQLSDPPSDWEICPCCDTFFGYSDRGRSHAVLRAAWVAEGMPWGSTVIAPPPNWSPMAQLRKVTSEDTV
jgi:hypothetical protein